MSSACSACAKWQLASSLSCPPTDRFMPAHTNKPCPQQLRMCLHLSLCVIFTLRLRLISQLESPLMAVSSELMSPFEPIYRVTYLSIRIEGCPRLEILCHHHHRHHHHLTNYRLLAFTHSRMGVCLSVCKCVCLLKSVPPTVRCHRVWARSYFFRLPVIPRPNNNLDRFADACLTLWTLRRTLISPRKDCD